MITGFGHVNFQVKDMEKSMHFYCDILGLKHAFDIRDEEGKLRVRYLKISDGKFIEFLPPGPNANQQQAADGAPKKPQSSFRHISLEVDDLNELIALLNKQGIEITSGPKTGRDLNAQCFAKDPDGNSIEFMQMDANSPQRRSLSATSFPLSWQNV